MTTETQQIMAQLIEIKSDLDFIKDRLKDMDILLTEDDYRSLAEAESDLKTGKTKRL